MRNWKENNLKSKDLIEVKISTIFKATYTRPLLVFVLEDDMNRVLPVYTDMHQNHEEGVEKIKIHEREGDITSVVFFKSEIKEMEVGRSVFLAYTNRADIYISRGIMEAYGIKIPDEKEVLEIQIEGLKDYLRNLKLKNQRIRIYKQLKDHLSNELKILEDRLHRINEE